MGISLLVYVIQWESTVIVRDSMGISLLVYVIQWE